MKKAISIPDPLNKSNVTERLNAVYGNDLNDSRLSEAIAATIQKEEHL
jgi:hypothetical protein